ncbi:MAG: dihydroneopterin aldolase [Campylobacterota bacterium]|nr:dihydroneopterin aldolase [Campylobacterota bacterium]
MQIHIDDLSFECIIGLLDFERVKPQRVILTCKIEYSYQESQFINYADVADSMTSHMKNEKFELLESALEFLSEQLLASYPKIELLYLKIAKPDILANATVALSEHYHVNKLK